MAINVLPRHLVNKIAAGEVIERPASVVKELVENAVDAGATAIDVTVEDGGKRLIAVTDDGAGMSAEDTALSFAPHATSKLSGEDDLFRIATMGFRGEALASIASISHAHIRSRRRDDDGGSEIQADGDSTGQVRPCAAAPGTTVTVRDLFFNTPARRKFMRKANTEAGHISEQIARLALPHPQIAFTLTHNGRRSYSLSPTDSTRQRVADLFTSDLADALLPISPRRGPVGISGLIGPPAAGRGSGRWQYFFLNGRYIRDRTLSHALREAYRGLIEPSRFPVAFIFIEVDPAEVDVNVHPTKIEVRFRDSQLVHGELLAALKDTLGKADLAPAASLDVASAPDPADVSARQGSLRQALADFFKSAPPPQPRLAFREGATRSAPFDQAETHADLPPLGQQAMSTARADAPAAPHAGAVVDAATPPAPGQAEPDRGGPAPRANAMQIHNAYIVAAAADGLIIVDQHALHERLLYNDLQRRLAEGSLAGQRMLIPESFPVTDAEADLLEQQAPLLGRLGIELARFGPQTMAIQRFPILLAERSVPAGDFLRDLLDRFAEDDTTDSERLLEDMLETMACKAAVKAGDPLTSEEIDSLLARRESAEKGSSCPHGRPTTLNLTLRDLEKQFKRT